MEPSENGDAPGQTLHIGEVPVKLTLTCASLVLAATVTAAWSFDFPKRKPGEWQVTISTPGSRLPPRVQSICLDAATDALLYQAGLTADQKLCTDNRWSHSGAGDIVGDLTCRLGKTNTRIHVEITLKDDTAYREDIHTQYDPPLFGKTESEQVQDAKWVGACPADMKAGDIVTKPSPEMPLALHMNIRDMLKGSN